MRFNVWFIVDFTVWFMMVLSLFYHGGLKNVWLVFLSLLLAKITLEIMKTGWSPGQS